MAPFAKVLSAKRFEAVKRWEASTRRSGQGGANNARRSTETPISGV